VEVQKKARQTEYESQQQKAKIAETGYIR